MLKVGDLVEMHDVGGYWNCDIHSEPWGPNGAPTSGFVARTVKPHQLSGVVAMVVYAGTSGRAAELLLLSGKWAGNYVRFRVSFFVPGAPDPHCWWSHVGELTDEQKLVVVKARINTAAGRGHA